MRAIASAAAAVASTALCCCCTGRALAFTGATHALRPRDMATSQILMSHGTDAAAAPPAAASAYEQRKEQLKQVLAREYRSFFDPFESEYYRPNVKFIDPLNSLEGAENYANNVNMLGGRTLIGKVLFKDARINLHSVDEPGPRRLRTRWTLSMCFKLLPWQPTPVFTGVSEYTLDDEGYIVQQNDFWDSINLKGGRYEAQGKLVGLADFAAQLKSDDEAKSATQGELPFELLRRAATYEVRRYPATVVASAAYETRPEGYAQLGAYADGANSAKQKLSPLSPSVMEIQRTGEQGGKTMLWPLAYRMPGGKLVNLGGLGEAPEAASGGVTVAERPACVVAVMKFADPTTEQFVKYYTAQLDAVARADGLVPKAAAADAYTVAQYNAIYSLSKRRNEVWLPLEGHDWQERGF
ncbi:hypothetical protein JKP88DRAFT_269898 [Tribonema minus]|uniref:SOUL heme-binding protein n=1 Tax=Tribonema minus TaxID=303371 RepID=A0A836CE30_9STRA|nr:hypothetical protein JKP88DRAFT_269898 [Tribonema minus]